MGAASGVTMGGGSYGDVVVVKDFPLIPPQVPPVRRMKYIAEDYFESMQNPVLAGRPIEWSDVHDRAPVVVVTENFAEEYWGSGAAALGKRIGSGLSADAVTWHEIIGVVGNVYDDGVSQPETPMIFWPLAVNRLDGIIYTARSEIGRASCRERV